MMIKLAGYMSRLTFCGFFVLWTSVSSTQARPWSHTPTGLAQDYVVINDTRGKGDLVLLFWMAPEIIEDGAAGKAARDLLDKYIIIGAVHAHVSNLGAMSFDPVSTLSANDTKGQPLTLLSADVIPPAIAGALASLQTGFGQSLGALGKGVQWFAFESGSIHACAKGVMSVPFEGETYTYTTPIPGCP